MNLDIDSGLELIAKARNKERDERIFKQWTAQFPLMALSGKAESFDEYRDRVTGANIDLRPTGEILAEVDEAEAQFEKEERKRGNI